MESKVAAEENVFGEMAEKLAGGAGSWRPDVGGHAAAIAAISGVDIDEEWSKSKKKKKSTYCFGKGFNSEHYAAARPEDIPFIRMACAVLRRAVRDMLKGDKALEMLLDMRATPVPATDAGRVERVNKLNFLLKEIEEAQASVIWANGADALVTFAMVSEELGLLPSTVRRLLAKAHGFATVDPRHSIVTRYEVYAS